MPDVAIDVGRSLSSHIDAAVESLERRYLDAVLALHNGAICRAAATAGISRRTLLRKMVKYGLRQSTYKTQRVTQGPKSMGGLIV